MPARRAGLVWSTVLLLALLLNAFGFPAQARGADAPLVAVADIVGAWYRGDFAAMEARATALLDAAPEPIPGDIDAIVARAGAFLVASIGATLAEAFDPGAAAAGAARRLVQTLPPDRRADLDPIVSFADAFNAHRQGRPLAAVSILGPVINAPRNSHAPAVAWWELCRALAANARIAVGDLEPALELSAAASGALTARLGAAHPLAVLARLWHVEGLVAAGRPEAEAAVEAMLDEPQRGQPMPVLGARLAHLALGFVRLGEIDAAARLVFDAATAGVPPDDTLVAVGLSDLAYAAEVGGDHRAAVESLDAALNILGQKLDPAAPAIGEAMMSMAMAAANLGAAAPSLELAAGSVAVARRGTGPASHVTATRLVEAATVHSIGGDPEAALRLLGEARQLLAGLDERDWRLTRVYLPVQEAKALMAAGRPAEAATRAADVIAGLSATPWAGGPVVSLVETDRALALSAAGDDAAAAASARRALGGLLETRGFGDVAVGGIFAAGKSAGSVNDSLRLAARTLIRSAWRQSAVSAPR